MNSKVYNDIPETRGTARNQGTYGEAGTERDRQDAATLAAMRARAARELAAEFGTDVSEWTV